MTDDIFVVATDSYLELDMGDEAIIEFYPNLIEPNECSKLADKIYRSIKWPKEPNTLPNMYGKKAKENRIVVWMGEGKYHYTGLTLDPIPWIKEIEYIKDKVEKITKDKYGGVLINYYRDSNDKQEHRFSSLSNKREPDYLGMHQDKEKNLIRGKAIASVTICGNRDFYLQRINSKDDQYNKVQFKPLPSGSLLLMSWKMNELWKHGVPKRANVDGYRINLTFRCYQK